MKINKITTRTPVKISFQHDGNEIHVTAYVDFKNREIEISAADHTFIPDEAEFTQKVFEYFEDEFRSDEIELPQEIQDHMIRVQSTAAQKMQEIKDSNDRTI